jgi:hypothetical protein
MLILVSRTVSTSYAEDCNFKVDKSKATASCMKNAPLSLCLSTNVLTPTYEEPKPPECWNGAKTDFDINYDGAGMASVLIRLLLK